MIESRCKRTCYNGWLQKLACFSGIHLRMRIIQRASGYSSPPKAISSEGPLLRLDIVCDLSDPLARVNCT
jgi:hypothetical protein